MKHNIFGSDGTILEFDNPIELGAYEFDIENVTMKHYGIRRQKVGIYASNQNAYVKSCDEFNASDSRAMEIRYAAYVRRQALSGRTYGPKCLACQGYGERYTGMSTKEICTLCNGLGYSCVESPEGKS